MYKRPMASAIIRGSDKYPEIKGRIQFFAVNDGVMVRTQIFRLPKGKGDCGGPVLAFHIHSGKNCTGNNDDPFYNANGHYNPKLCRHPFHAGDMPPLLANRGNAFSTFYTNRFYPEDVVGRVVVVHAMPDDFKSQPSGNPGTILACGIIEEV